MALVLRIVDPQVAAFIGDRKRGRHLDPFLANDSSVAEAATALGIGPQRMHYWVRRMEGLGLVEKVGTELRGRNHTAVYRSSADAYSLPLELLPTGDMETLELHFQPVWRRFLRSLVAAGRKYADGWVISYRRTSGLPAFHIEPATAPVTDAPIANAWVRLELTHGAAMELKRELESLVGRYRAQPTDPNAKPFLAHVGLVEAVE
ncbi:MAG: hypothetical protein KF875_06325 [Trueperaceae bacterium]|nr:hypothetical protein [Trueperaceae bacterium]MCO5173386.1 hypothetical protein [Trueperaceae bacterium]MCW5819221.1 hypothetical protein [Trueperaceae bacterium]